MTIELKMNTNVRYGVQLIRDEEVNPIIDLDGVRYLIDIDLWWMGGIRWTKFDILTQQVIGTVSYERHYASHNRFYELLIGSNVSERPLLTSTFPSFPVPNDYGTVTP